MEAGFHERRDGELWLRGQRHPEDDEERCFSSSSSASIPWEHPLSPQQPSQQQQQEQQSRVLSFTTTCSIVTDDDSATTEEEGGNYHKCPTSSSSSCRGVGRYYPGASPASSELTDDDVVLEVVDEEEGGRSQRMVAGQQQEEGELGQMVVERGERAGLPAATAARAVLGRTNSATSSSSKGKVEFGTLLPPPPPPRIHRRMSFSGTKRVIPVRIDLQDLNITVKRREGCWWNGKAAKKAILRDVNLSFVPGQLVGIMGPSGCGKTTLLRAIHGNPKHAKHVSSGGIYANYTPIKSIHQVFRRICCMVPQEDVLLPTFTVWDTLLYAAHLRLSCQEDKASVVKTVIMELGLEDCKDVAIRRVSGGQKRRVSIGLELLVDPSIILLDEATSGLDSKTTEDLCKLLANLAGPGRCVITTIHQPAYQIFLSFDRICFMVQGRVTYDGPAVRVKEFFESMGLDTPSYENPADFYIRKIQEDPQKVLDGWEAFSSGDKVPAGADDEVVQQRGSRMMLTTPALVMMTTRKGRQQEKLRVDEGASWLEDHTIVTNSTMWEFGVLLCRMLQDAFQDPVKLLAGILIEAAVGVLLGLGWFQLNIHENKSIFPILGVMIMLTTLGVMDSCLAICVRFPQIRALHMREYSNGYYRLFSYFAASMVTGCALCSLYQIVQGSIVYAMVGLDASHPGKILVFLSIVLLSACTGSGIGFLIGVVTSEVKMMQHYLTPVLMPMMLYSGYMLPYKLIPRYLKPIYYVSIYQWVYSAFVVNHFKGLVFDDCSVAQGLSGVCAHTGEQVLEHNSLDADQLPHTIVCITALFAVTCGLGFLVLQRKSH